MITYAEALERIGAEVWQMPTETLLVGESLGRALAETIVAPFDLPMFDNSAVDGYGVRVCDLADSSDESPVTLKLSGTSQAGGPIPASLEAGATVQVLTGAPIPARVEAVVMQEDVAVGESGIRFGRPAAEGAHIRRQGEEFRSGDALFGPGTLVSPPILASLNGLGLTHVQVHQLPKVGILSTGNELISPGEPLKPGKIYESNTAGLTAALSAAGIRNVESWRVRDEQETTEAALEELLSACDVVLTTGGVSVGDFDTVKPALANLGVRQVFWKCAIKPGKPIWFGVCESDERRTLVFGLPGNPVSALVTYAMFAVPALRALSGLGFAPQPAVSAVLGEPLHKSGDRLEFVRCTLGSAPEALRAYPILQRGSHMLGSMGTAEGLIHFPLDSADLAEGDTVSVTPLRWGWV